ncbi:family 16 glycosylhydrolase [Roseateles sp. So40a]|uniref:glycoside hydrolase family 16 protein n=1 Tax=Roseateles sp. So40a TaxID=3400226 RepID=UPI003A87FEE3
MKQRLTRRWSATPLMTALAVTAMTGVTALGGDAVSAQAAQAAQTATGKNGAASGPIGLPAGYTLVWSDEFDRNGLPDESRWAYDTGMNKQGWHNREKQYYAGPRMENASVRDGKLVITARKESMSSLPDWGGQQYTSTRLITKGKAEWTYGYFEIRAKLPCGQGTWPAIWMLGSQGDWPASGELDILEHMGQKPEWVFSTVHTTTGHGGHGVGDGRVLKTACSGFHTYQMLWTPQEVRFGIDGQVHAAYPNLGKGSAQWPFAKPQFLILNLAIGGDLGGEIDDRIFPIGYEVEFVRVYQQGR